MAERMRAAGCQVELEIWPRMRAAGCQVELEIWPRMPHTWQVWARVLPEARAAIERIGAFVQSKM
jgi:epsilon-lactone hydrolase